VKVYDAVAYSNYYELFNGYDVGIYTTNDSMTRVMFVTVLYNLEGNPAPNRTGKFNNVPPLWHVLSRRSAMNGRFAPDRAITRLEMAVIMINYTNYKGYDIP
jgi:hypothetical protein